MICQLVLVKDIHLWEAKGWKLTDDKVHVRLGNWPSVYMEKGEEGD